MDVGGIFGWGGDTSKIFKRFLKKSAKMHYFRLISKGLTIHAIIFCAFGRKTQMLGNFEKKFGLIFDETSIEKLNF